MAAVVAAMRALRGGRRSLATVTRVCMVQGTLFRFPAMSPTMESGAITRWYKKEGDAFQPGDQLLNVETDKANIDVDAVEGGVLAKILVPEGSANVLVSTPIALLVEEGEDWKSATMPPDTGAVASSPATPKSQSQPSSPPKAAEPTAHRKQTTGAATTAPLSPAVANLVARHDLDPTAIPATGPKGRLLKGDVLEFLAQGAVSRPAAPAAPAATKAPTSQPPAVPQPSSSEFTTVPVSTMRSVIAKRLTESKFTVPHKYTMRTVGMDAIMALRKRLNASLDAEGRLSVNDFVVKAVALALRDVPEVNVVYRNGVAEPVPTVDISIAVAIDGGLITPIVRQADTLGLRAISTTTKQLAAKARSGKLQPHEYQGGSFSISNLGMYGIKHFSAVINPPQAAILAVASGQPTLTVKEDGTIGTHSAMAVQLSSDERAIDADVAARFLEALARRMENPESLLL